MSLNRVQRKTERTPEELARLRAVREEFQRARPSLEDLVETGEYDGPVRQGDILDFLSTLAMLKRERERRGLSLSEVAERSGITKGMLSRLENGKILNPTLATLWRYADAIGARVSLTVETETAGVV